MHLRSWKSAPWAITFTSALGVVWWIGDLSLRAWILPMALLLLLAGTAQGALARARLDSSPAFRWRALAGFCLLGVYNACLHLFQVFRFGPQLPHPPVATLLLWGPAFLLLLAAFNGKDTNHPGASTRMLDGGVFGLAAYLGLWMWVIKPAISPGALEPMLAVGIHLSLLIACTTLGVALHVWIERAAPLNSPIGLIALGTLTFAVVLPWWASVILGGTFRLSHPVRIAFLPSFLLLYLGTQAPWPERQSRPNEALRLALPYIPTVIAFVGFLTHYLPRSSDRDATGLALLGALAILVLLRQALTLRQIFLLNRELEEKVEARTRELSRSQGLLMETQQKNLVATLGAGITHDLNNLLGAALGNLDLLRMKLGPVESREMDGLEKALDRAGSLSKSLMGLARGGPGPSRTFDLRDHLEELHPLLRAMVPRNIHLAWEQGEGPLLVQATPGQVDQVVVNLVSNAKDATPPGGRINLRVSDGGSQAMIEVQDTGTGIPNSVMEHLFEPFLTTKPAGKGTGLGLSSVRAVVEHLGGSIDVATTPGEGTTFTVRLPKAPLE